jgi:cytochrome c5
MSEAKHEKRSGLNAVDPADDQRLRGRVAGDSADGKRLHDANCMGCHDTGIYIRKDHWMR